MTTLTKATAKEVAHARGFLSTNPAAYARLVSATWRTASAAQQRAVEAAIAADEAAHLFDRLPNGCLIAKREG